MNKKLIVFFDTVGRTIIAEEVERKDSTLKVKNPVIVHIVPNQQTGQMALQLLPGFFKEFQADKTQDTEWTYNLNMIAPCTHVDLDFRLISQYSNMFSNIEVPENPIVTPDQVQQPPQGPQQGSEVVNLFDK